MRGVQIGLRPAHEAQMPGGDLRLNHHRVARGDVCASSKLNRIDQLIIIAHDEPGS